MQRRVLVPFREIDRSQPYLDALQLGGLNPVPFITESSRHLADMAGLVLTGGTDINPTRYGETPETETEPPDSERDEIESELLAEALHKDLPVLAICRGFQLLNVHQGGTLLQHILADQHRVITGDKGKPAHDVEIEAASRVAEIFGSTRVAVNSRHHQALKDLGTGLTLVGWSIGDGVPEAVELVGKRFVVGVQWHPENQVAQSAEQLRLFQAFAKAVNQ